MVRRTVLIPPFTTAAKDGGNGEPRTHPLSATKTSFQNTLEQKPLKSTLLFAVAKKPRILSKLLSATN